VFGGHAVLTISAIGRDNCVIRDVHDRTKCKFTDSRRSSRSYATAVAATWLMEMVDERVSAVDRGAPTTLHELKERSS